MQPVFPGEVYIENGKTHRELARLGFGFVPVCGGRNLQAFLAKIEREQLTNRSFVINKQDVRLHARFLAGCSPKCKPHRTKTNYRREKSRWRSTPPPLRPPS